MSELDVPDPRRRSRAGGDGDGGARPWVRGQGKRLSLRGGDARSSEGASARRSSLPRRASEKRLEAGSGSAWAHYMERARQAVGASEVPAIDFDTVEVEIEEAETPRGRFERLSEPPPDWASRRESPFAQEHPLHHEPAPAWEQEAHEEALSARETQERSAPSREPRSSPYLSLPVRAPEPPPDDPPPSATARSASDAARSRAAVDYPDWFVTNGLALLLSGDAERAQRYYTSCTRKAPDHPEGWYGLAAVYLRRGRTAEATDAFLRGWTIEDGFPVGTFLRDACADDVEAWYTFAGALVAKRRRQAYQCADLALLEVIDDPSSSSALRQRAGRVRRSIAVALEARAAHDRRRGGVLAGLPRALVHSVVILVVLGAVAAAGLWAVRGGRIAVPGTGAKAVAPSPGAVAASPPRVAEPAQTAPEPGPSEANEGPPSAEAPADVQVTSDADSRAASASAQSEPTSGTVASEAPRAEEPSSPDAALNASAEAMVEVSDDHGNGHTVKLDGEVAGVTPLTLVVRPGVPCTITVLPRGGKRPWQVRLTPTAGKTKRLEAELPGS